MISLSSVICEQNEWQDSGVQKKVDGWHSFLSVLQRNRTCPSIHLSIHFLSFSKMLKVKLIVWIQRHSKTHSQFLKNSWFGKFWFLKTFFLSETLFSTSVAYNSSWQLGKDDTQNSIYYASLKALKKKNHIILRQCK